MPHSRYKVVLSSNEYEEFISRTTTGDIRYELLEINGNEFYICNQWGVNEIKAILDKAKALGYEVNSVISDDVMNNFFQNGQIGERFKTLYEQQTDKNKNIIRSLINLVHQRKYDWYFINIGSPEKSLRFGVKRIEDIRARSAVRLYFKDNSIFLSAIDSVISTMFSSDYLNKLKNHSKNTRHFMLEINDDTIHIINEGMKNSPDGHGRFPNDYEVEEPSYNENEDQEVSEPAKKTEIRTQPLNTILFGPPGTGKTYTTINHALSILMGSEAPVDRTKAKEEFDAYVAKGQIVFTTFHQSYGYEEFIEGIKPDINPESSEIRYKVQDGVFKALCQTALSKVIQSESISTFNRNKNSVWKFSLGNSQNGEDQIYLEEAIQSDSIILGWGDKTDYSNCKNYNDILQSSGNDKSTARYVNIFKHEIKVGDIAIISDGNRSFKAIVEITGDYFFDAESDLPQKRKIKWLKQFNNPMPYYEISKKYFTQSTINKPQHIDFDKLNKLISHEFLSNTDKNYVIIIDEINRGNISKIFGELITLIEATKRIGAPEELRVALPYSGNEFDDGKGFGVPNNVHIIGTMNTADRSIALMDTALRRRFEFIEMMPDYDVITKEVGTINLVGKELDIAEMLKTINQRISYLYDRDHQIGHAYLLSLKDKKDEEALAELDNIFRNKIIPLLQEYFYDDWEKIQLVLGDHYGQLGKPKELSQNASEQKNRFIKSWVSDEKTIFGYNHDNIEDSKTSYVINTEFTPTAYLKITDSLL